MRRAGRARRREERSSTTLRCRSRPRRLKLWRKTPLARIGGAVASAVSWGSRPPAPATWNTARLRRHGQSTYLSTLHPQDVTHMERIFPGVMTCSGTIHLERRHVIDRPDTRFQNPDQRDHLIWSALRHRAEVAVLAANKAGCLAYSRARQDARTRPAEVSRELFGAVPYRIRRRIPRKQLRHASTEIHQRDTIRNSATASVLGFERGFMFFGEFRRQFRRHTVPGNVVEPRREAGPDAQDIAGCVTYAGSEDRSQAAGSAHRECFSSK